MPAISEKDITKQFKSASKKLIKEAGSKALYNDELDELARKHLGKKWKGVYSQDNVPIDKPGYFIFNTDTSDGPGEHWVALASTGKHAYIYDSFGRPTAKLLKLLTKRFKGAGIKYKDVDDDAEQFGTTEICGPLCVSWLMMAQKHGVRPALKI